MATDESNQWTRLGFYPLIHTPTIKHTSVPIIVSGLSVISLPFWWLLGIEQAIWPVIFVFLSIVLKSPHSSVMRGRIRINQSLKWLAALIVVQLISSIFINENYRWITFIRNFSIYITGFAVIYVFTNFIRNKKEINFIVNSIIFMFLLAGMIGVLGYLDIYRPGFLSAIGYILPDFIRNTDYGGAIAWRSTGVTSWFLNRTYFRVSSFFLYGTMFATALAIVLPLCTFKLTQSRTVINKFYFGFSILLLTINLIFTTGRIAMLSLLIGAIYYLAIESRIRTLAKITIILGIILISTVLFITPQLASGTYETFIFARGSGSYDSRSYVYLETIKGIFERPLLGWGTERNIPNSSYPAGSHSYYLGILYRHGVIGFVLFIGFLVSIWKNTRPVRWRMPVGEDIRYLINLMKYGRWILVTIFVNSTTDIFDLDATTMLMLWFVFGLLLVSRKIIVSAKANGMPGNSMIRSTTSS